MRRDASRRCLAAALAVLASWGSACSGGAQAAGSEPTTRVVSETSEPETASRATVLLAVDDLVEPVRVDAELALTRAEQRRGLMYRRYLRRNTGMLFVFPSPRRASFWMINTFVALDLIFIGADHSVVGVVEHARPFSDDEQAIEAESLYVLEVSAGFCSTHGITAGTPVSFENLPPSVTERSDAPTTHADNAPETTP